MSDNDPNEIDEQVEDAANELETSDQQSTDLIKREDAAIHDENFGTDEDVESNVDVEEPVANETLDNQEDKRHDSFLTRWKNKRKARKQAKIKSVVMQFQPDVVELEHRAVPGGARFALWTVFLLIVSAVAWSCYFKVDRVVEAQGKLVTPNQPIILQPAAGAPIKSVYKKFGDIVEPGEVLAELDPTLARVNYEQGLISSQALQATVDRLNKENGDEQYEIDRTKANQFELQQLVLFQTRQSEYRKKIQDLELTIESLDTKIKNNSDDQLALNQLVEVNNRIRQLSIEGFKKGVVSETTIQDQKRTRLSDQRQYNQAIARAKELKNELEVSKKKRDTFIAEWKTRIVTELAKAEQDLAMTNKNLEQSKMMTELVTIRVPEDTEYQKFMVVEAAERSVGSVAREGEPLFKLLPLDDKLELENRDSRKRYRDY